MRVALDLREGLDPWTGMGRYGLAVTRELARRGRHTWLGLIDKGSRLPADLREAGVEPLPVAAPAFHPIEHLRLGPVLREARVDHLHALSYALPLVAPCPRSLTIFDPVPLLFPAAYRPRARLYWRLVLPITVRQARFVVTLSQTSRRDLLARLPANPERMVVCPPGVGPPFTGEAPSTPEAHAPRYLLTHGNQRPHKNLSALLAAFEFLAKRHPDLQLYISGGQRRQDTERVRWLGQVDDQELARLYRGARLYVLPSLYEGAGLTPLEAMACGTPCVLSNGGALPELWGDAAMIAGTSADELAQGIERLLGDEGARRRLVEAGRERARELTWEAAAAAVEERVERWGGLRAEGSRHRAPPPL